jgi:hypothetical protein
VGAAVELGEHGVPGELERLLPLLGVLLLEVAVGVELAPLAGVPVRVRAGWADDGMKIGVNSDCPSIARFQLRAKWLL